MPDERRGRRLAICTGHADDPELLLWIAVEIGEDKGRCLPHIRTAKLQYIPLRELRDQRAAGTCGLCGRHLCADLFRILACAQEQAVPDRILQVCCDRANIPARKRSDHTVLPALPAARAGILDRCNFYIL